MGFDEKELAQSLYLPWTRPLNTWLFPARVASHSMEVKRICDSEITTCFMSGRRMGSSSTHCFASMANYALTSTKKEIKYQLEVQSPK